MIDKMINNNKIIVLSDIDDTAIETFVKFYKKESKIDNFIPGYKNIVSFINDHIYFITVRPKIINYFSSFHKYLTNVTFLHCPLSCFILSIIIFIFRKQQLINSVNKYIAIHKYNLIVDIINKFPDYQYIWFGDNLQGDAIVAQLLITNYSQSIIGCYIRKIINNNILCDQNIFYFNSYIEVAYELYKKNIIDLNKLKIINDEFMNIECINKYEQKFVTIINNYITTINQKV